MLVCHVRSLPCARLFKRAFSKTADFGFKDVNAEEKEKLVKEVFSNVAQKYDVMNDFMSLGIHRLWKDEFVSQMGIISPPRLQMSPPPRHLDVAGGTGDIAFRSVKEMLKVFHGDGNKFLRNGEDNCRQVVVCDINPEMLSVGKDRAPTVLGAANSSMVGFVEGNAEKLPFPDESFDFYTIAFGLRNVTNKDSALKEAHRVLRQGGRIMILEFSHLENPMMQFVYDQYSFNVIPKIGHVVANDAASYQYLVESIRRFPKQRELVSMMTEAGFRFSTYTNLTFGVVAIHSGFKL